MKPNVLVIFADQMRADSMGCAGHPLVRTPNLDRIAAEGVRFVNAYTPDPICVPARAAFTTGNYPHVCTGSKNNSGRIRDDQLKIAEVFAARGYGAYASGKLHYVPYSPPGAPRLLHGFQKVALHESGRVLAQFGPDGSTPGLEDYHDHLKTVGWDGYARAHGVGNNDIHPAPSPLPAEHYCDAWVADQGMRLLDEHAAERPDDPFFLFLSFPKPHAPYDPPRPYDSLYDPRAVPAPFAAREENGIPRSPPKHIEAAGHGWPLWSPQTYRVARAHYYGQITFQDEQIGRVLDYLEERGRLDDTVVVYTADHGDLLGDFGFFAKCCFYRGSVQIPLLIRWPKQVRQGLVADQLVGLQDLLPTLASLAGFPLDRKVDGMDLAPLLRGEDAPEREWIVSYCLGPGNQLYMVADKRWKFCYSEIGGSEELYDLANDPGEEWNVADRAEHAALLATMRERLRAWAVEHGDRDILAGDGLVQNDKDVLANAAFQPKAMGWRWH